MDESFDTKSLEKRIQSLWESQDAFCCRDATTARGFTMFLVPPNASGPLHIGNALMVALQDVLARYHRMQGTSTLWVPGTDHGGYETQITYQREQEGGDTPQTSTREQQYARISEFVDRNIEIIHGQIQRLGASVDWSKKRFTLDATGRACVQNIFDRMIRDELIYRREYMTNYCSQCGTVLADIELKEVADEAAQYGVIFPSPDGGLRVVTTRPEYLFTVTHILVHPNDMRYAHLIGTDVENPITGEPVRIERSTRKWVPEHATEQLVPFMPTALRYDYEYALRNGIPAYDVLTWEGTFTRHYTGLTPSEARDHAVEHLRTHGLIESEETCPVPHMVCKKGHRIINVIRQSWFMRLDAPHCSLKKHARAAIEKERLLVLPQWRIKGLVEWIDKMHDWPISRQNVWGIRIPVWYRLNNPQLLTVWFRDIDGTRRSGNLAEILNAGVDIATVRRGLERVYAGDGVEWTHLPQESDEYIQDTDTFDTWFSSGAWGTTVFGLPDDGLSIRYPSDVLVIGNDLLRLSVARKIFMSVYLSGSLPFKSVYLHPLIKGADGQKMSKSLGNSVSLDHYLDRYGADVTRMTLVSYTSSFEDFVLDEQRCAHYQQFQQRVWRMARAYEALRKYASRTASVESAEIEEIGRLSAQIGRDIERLFLARAQSAVVDYVSKLEQLAESILDAEGDSVGQRASVFLQVFETYMPILHPFMPFMTEEIARSTGSHAKLLALSRWPRARHVRTFTYR